MSSEKSKPDFFIIGAQKSGTSWLWDMLKQHPGTSLPTPKEIHYFGSAELYAQGDDWYFSHFAGLNPDKVIGEASTTYFYDRVPYWHNESRQIEFDETLPILPKLIDQKFPDAKYIVTLRDPVRRAISAYSHLMRRAPWMKSGALSPSLGLKKTAMELPKMRILEYGLYAKYLKVWMKQIPAERFRIILFEDQIKKNWDKTLFDTYDYLGLDPTFQPRLSARPVHRSWGWTRILFNYYGCKIFKNIGNSKIAKLLDRFDILSNLAFNAEDIEFFRSVYLAEKDELSAITGFDLSCWDYGENILSD
ncbi:MAG: sulfotransferase [Desulforhopalus sp.]